MESLPALFALIQPYAWIGFAATALLICLVYESGFLLTIGTIAFAVFGALTFNLVHVETLVAHPILIVVLVAAYIVIGAIWVPFAWASHLRRVNDRVEDAILDWNNLPDDHYKKHKIGRKEGAQFETAVPKDETELAAERQQHIRDYVGQSLPVRVNENKARIICYMAYWPFSMVRTILDDPLRRLWNAIYHAYAERLQKMSNDRFQEFR